MSIPPQCAYRSHSLKETIVIQDGISVTQCPVRCRVISLCRSFKVGSTDVRSDSFRLTSLVDFCTVVRRMMRGIFHRPTRSPTGTVMP